ncbi:2-oxoglutarate dehydrogenase complex dihydrolipoyllysine-residue succinyltransferase [Pseudomonadota bacterium]|jgi:2-oxoglutarate dehydrogenase E2 component (dihydrolipoamide succinyltransferase)|nr:2-oxoglutarate dehydrogenase complex dihydrolipoyllysine-residue succinyltransferase [Pseudomonadota bacterium]|tara:strand:+ start:2723 stop:3961 length:1239 start_codon:yes stop_codon:yes gene_type:complete
MAIKIKSPTFPESVSDGTVANWVKKEGETVLQDDVIAEIETDKVVLEVLAPADGKIAKIHKKEGDVVQSAELIGEFLEGADIRSDDLPKDQKKEQIDLPSAVDDAAQVMADAAQNFTKTGPAAKKIAQEKNIDLNSIDGSGKGGRVTKADVLNYASNNQSDPEKPAITKDNDEKESTSEDRETKRVAMSRIRATIAKRLVEVQQNTAMLTTFNEVDMQPIKNLRKKHGEEFLNEHGVKLGFMGFFVAACVNALGKFPLVNASIDGEDIVYHNFKDIGVAVSTERGLVVPILKDADLMTIPEIESAIFSLAEKAREGKLSIEEMQGGTFTISNGGIFGSLLSTPILNAPQTAILGMHKIEDRPVVVEGEIVVRPMMYLAMSYDHRMLDGKEAVSFLVSVKEQLENPEKLLLNL